MNGANGCGQVDEPEGTVPPVSAKSKSPLIRRKRRFSRFGETMIYFAAIRIASSLQEISESISRVYFYYRISGIFLKDNILNNAGSIFYPVESSI